MNNKDLSIQFLFSTGLVPVELNDNDKSPTKGYSLVDIGRLDRQSIIQKWGMGTIKNMGALFHGRFIDVDVDSFEPTLREALDKMLPHTDLIWGREGKRRSHRVYQTADDFERAPLSRHLRVIKEMAVANGVSYSVELRGGRTNEGMYTVLPGSFIDLGPEANAAKGYSPKGETIEWEKGVDPSVSPAIVDPINLIKRIRMAQACAILAPHWVVGRRNNLSLALSGLWWKIASLTNSLMDTTGITPEDVPHMLVLTMEDCELMMETICELANDDESDRKSRMMNLRNTWRKMDEPDVGKVTGGGTVVTTIGEGGSEIVDVLYRLLSDSPALQEIDKWLEKLVIWYGRGALVDLDMVKDGEAESWMSRQSAENTFGRESIEIYDYRMPLVKFIYTSKMVKYIRGLTLDPSKDSLLVEQKGHLFVNQWRGFDVKPHDEEVSAEYMAPFIDYVYNILASGDQMLGDWIMGWIAHILQAPEKKAKTALVFVGTFGAGKTFLSENILHPIIGAYHSTSVSNVEDITGKFNMILDNKVLVTANEAIHKNKYVSSQALKAYISDDTIQIEPKNINRYEKPNFARFIFTSNDEHDAVFIEPSPFERRFTVVKVSDSKVGPANKEYWNTLAAWCRANRPRIARYLMDFKIDWRLISTPYHTKAKAKMQTNATNVELNWIIDRLIDGYPLSKETQNQWWMAFSSINTTREHRANNLIDRTQWPDRITWDALEEDFRNYFRKWMKNNYKANARAAIKGVFPYDLKVVNQTDVKFRALDGTQSIKRIRIYELPPKEHIIEQIKARYGADLIEQLLDEKDLAPAPVLKIDSKKEAF